jgi:hypothetical protein
MSTTTKAVSASAWKKAKVHEGITLPSGAVVDITIPNLATLISSGTLPTPLVDAAMRLEGAPDDGDGKRKVTPEVLKETWDFIEYIVPLMVVKPSITSDDLEDLPVEDVEMLASFATRSNDIDAIGHHIGGLETHRRFRELRGLITLDEVVSGGGSDEEAAA